MYRTYTGHWPAPAAPWGTPGIPHGGHCQGCGQPHATCCCRECRTEAKELVVKAQPRDAPQTPGAIQSSSPLGFMAMRTVLDGARLQDELGAGAKVDMQRAAIDTAAAQQTPGLGMGEAFIGGGCCVSLSIEYTPSSPTVTAIVGVLVRDAEGTLMAWLRTEQPGAGYKVKEGIIATNPGATLVLVVVNATARVRWCETFSC